MPADRAVEHSGGCQCGTVRFACYAEPDRIGVCHCRMCQKAIAGPFGVFVVVRSRDFAWTRGQPASFRSSSRAMRDFCSACGTPLSYREIDGDSIEMLVGSFDRPERLAPTYEVGAESKLGWLDRLGGLPSKTTFESVGAERLAAIANFQHPDYETPNEAT